MSLLPVHFVQVETPWEAFQCETTTRCKSKALTCSKLANDFGDEDLAGLGTSADTEGGVNGRAEQAIFRENRLTSIETNTHADRSMRMLLVVLGEGPLNGQGTFDGIGSRAEGCF